MGLPEKNLNGGVEFESYSLYYPTTDRTPPFFTPPHLKVRRKCLIPSQTRSERELWVINLLHNAIKSFTFSHICKTSTLDEQKKKT